MPSRCRPSGFDHILASVPPWLDEVIFRDASFKEAVSHRNCFAPPLEVLLCGGDGGVPGVLAMVVVTLE
jgi:hypothetical protein